MDQATFSKFDHREEQAYDDGFVIYERWLQKLDKRNGYA